MCRWPESVQDYVAMRSALWRRSNAESDVAIRDHMRRDSHWRCAFTNVAARVYHIACGRALPRPCGLTFPCPPLAPAPASIGARPVATCGTLLPLAVDHRARGRSVTVTGWWASHVVTGGGRPHPSLTGPGFGRGLFFCRHVRLNTYMDSDLENVIRQALEDALLNGWDRMGQTVLAVQAVQRARPDMTASDALAAVSLMQRK